MAVKAPWDEFPELWSGGDSSDAVYGRYQKGIYAQGQNLVNQLQEQRLIQAAQEQATQDAIRDAVGGKSFDESLPLIKDILAQSGDVDSILKVQQEEQEQSRRKQLEQSGALQTIMAIAKFNPEMARQYAQHTGYGHLIAGHDLSGLQERPRDISVGGDLVRPNAAGGYDVVYRSPDRGNKPDKPEYHFGARGEILLKNPDGTLSTVREREPDPIAALLSDEGGAPQPKKDSYNENFWKKIGNVAGNSSGQGSSDRDVPPQPPPGFKLLGKNPQTGKWQIARDPGM